MSKNRQQKIKNTPNLAATKKVNGNFSTTNNWHKQHHINKAILFCVALLLYGWTYTFDYGIDDKFITSILNNIDSTFQGFLQIFKTWFAGADYRPISVLSFWVERIIFGSSSPHISHIVNVILFGCILIKIYDFVIVSKFYTDEKKLMYLALISSIFFAIHPNHVSVVVNIKARDNLLSMLFGLMACIQLIHFFDTKKRKNILWFLLLDTVAILSKLDMYAFVFIAPIVILLYREITWNKKKLLYYLGVSLALFFIIFIILSIFKTNLNQKEYIFSMGFDENPLVGNDTLLNRISLALTCLFYYIKFLVYPTDYYFFFGYNQIKLTSLFSIINISTLIILLGIMCFCFKTFSKNKIYTFCFLYFMLSIFYALNIYELVAGIVMDKYSFIASLGFCLCIAALFIDYLSIDKNNLYKSPILIALVCIFIFFTIYRTKDWKNSFTMLKKDMPSLTQSVNANRMAAGAYINWALDAELQSNNRRDFTDSLINIGEKYANNGLAVYDKVPDLLELKGLCFFYRKEYPQALSYFQKSKIVDSTYLSSINYIGYTFWALNQIDSAEYYFKYVIAREPVFYYSANNLLNLYLQTNKKAADSLIIALKQKYPDDKWLNKRISELNE